MTDAVLEALWAKVIENFDDDAAHQRFLEHCRQSGQLLEAATRYRAHKADTNDAEIDKRLSAIAIYAMAELESKRAEPKGRNPLALLATALVVAFFFAAIIGLVRALLS